MSGVKPAKTIMRGMISVKGIRFKLWTGMMGLVIVMLVLLWLFQIVFLESFYEGIRINEVMKQGTKLLQNASQAINKINSGIGNLAEASDSDISEFVRKMEEYAYNNSAGIEYINSNGEVIFVTGSLLTGNSNQTPMNMRNNARAVIIKNSLDIKNTVLTMEHPRFGLRIIFIGIPSVTGITGNKPAGILSISMPAAPVHETASILKKQLMYITIILVLSALLFSFLISKNFTKPILKIKEVAEKMASGDFSTRIPAIRKDEIGKLSASINYLGSELDKTEQLRKDLIANVSHELRTPLSLIQGYAETIADVTGENPEKRKKQLGIIIEETIRLSKLVDDMLNLSQMQAGIVKLDKTIFNIAEMLQASVKRFEILTDKTGVKLIFEANDNIPVYGDRTRLEQVVFNLLNNAFNHTPAGGEIKIDIIRKNSTIKKNDTININSTIKKNSTININSAMNINNTIKILIHDTGTGIPKEELPYIWDRYYKSSNTLNKTKQNNTVSPQNSRKTHGTGLGLAIVKAILEAHEAVYGADSIHGTGSTFWFELSEP